MGMSTTTVKAVWPGEKAEDLEELRNSHGSAPIVWNEIAKRYLGLGNYEYSFKSDEIWPLYKRDDMPAHHRAVLMMTYDNALVMKANYKQAAADIRAFLADFPGRPGGANHWSRIAEIFDNEPPCEAIGFHMTSVSEDPFQGAWNEERECHDAPEWSEYWDVYVEAAKWPAPNAKLTGAEPNGGASSERSERG
jgi:hypothetical protein